MRLRFVTVGATISVVSIIAMPASSWAGSRSSAIAEGSGEANGTSWEPAASADGRYVAFVSDASNLLGDDTANDTNGADDVFLADTVEGTIRLVSRDPVSADQANGASAHPDISSDGRYVVFDTAATNLVPADANGEISDVVRFDATDGSLTLVSRRGVAGAQGNGDSFAPSISKTGGSVSFISQATNLISNDTNGKADAYVRDVDAGSTTRVSTDSSGKQANNATYAAVVAPGAGWVAFSSIASNLVSGDTNHDRDVFEKNLGTGKTIRSSVRSDGRQGNGSSALEDISSNGRYVVLNSFASNLVKNDGNNQGDVFVRDRVDATTIRVSKRGSVEANDDSFGASVSDDGAYVVFGSRASNLGTDADGNGSATDVFEYTLATKALVRLTANGVGGWVDGGSYDASATPDGTGVVFASAATDLVDGDLNGWDDVFLRTWSDEARTSWSVDRLSVPSPGPG
jgi:Tol biopolymer transport system component